MTQNHGGQQDLGRREDDRDHVQLHAWVVQPHRVQAHPPGVRVGQGAQGRYGGGAGVRADALWEGEAFYFSKKYMKGFDVFYYLDVITKIRASTTY